MSTKEQIDSDEEINKKVEDDQKEVDQDENDDDVMKVIQSVGDVNIETNMKSFIENYGVEIEIPGYYI